MMDRYETRYGSDWPEMKRTIMREVATAQAAIEAIVGRL